MKTASRLEQVLSEGHFAVTTECGPPRGADPEEVRKKGELIKGMVDAVNITDNQTSVVRMSSLAGCMLLKDMGFDPIMQMVTRDRNRISIQSDILGAAALGVNNVLRDQVLPDHLSVDVHLNQAGPGPVAVVDEYHGPGIHQVRVGYGDRDVARFQVRDRPSGKRHRGWMKSACG